MGNPLKNNYMIGLPSLTYSESEQSAWDERMSADDEARISRKVWACAAAIREVSIRRAANVTPRQLRARRAER